MQPFAYGSKNYTRSVTYAQLFTTATKITTLTTKWGWGLRRGQRPVPRKIKMWWIVSLEHNNLVRKVHFSNKLFKTAQP